MTSNEYYVSVGLLLCKATCFTLLYSYMAQAASLKTMYKKYSTVAMYPSARTPASKSSPCITVDDFTQAQCTCSTLIHARRQPQYGSSCDSSHKAMSVCNSYAAVKQKASSTVFMYIDYCECVYAVRIVLSGLQSISTSRYLARRKGASH
jgi:hypothetical protein